MSIEISNSSPSDDVSREVRRWTEQAGAELHLQERRAWVIVVGDVGDARAHAIAGLVDALTWQPSLHRVSVDLTCTVMSDRAAAAMVDGLRAGAAPWVDMATAGPMAWHLRHGQVA